MTETTDPRRKALHDLRNHFNSIAMQTEVLKLYISEGSTAEALAAADKVIEVCRQGGRDLGMLSESLSASAQQDVGT